LPPQYGQFPNNLAQIRNAPRCGLTDSILRWARIRRSIAPLFKALDKEPRGPYRHEWEPLFTYIAVQWMRVPAFRPTLLRITDTIHRRFLAEVLKTRESWAAWLMKLGIPADTPGTDYDRMVEFERLHDYTLSAENEWFLQKGFEAMECIVSCLTERFWRASISERGGFIGCDNPVAMDGPKGKDVGFKTADIVLFPVSRHVLVYGANRRITPTTMSTKRVAAHNTFTMLTANEQVYSHVPNFYWLDENGKCQTDWKLFSRDKLVLSSILGLPIAVAEE
jgi:uncharacterized protein DUF4238